MKKSLCLLPLLLGPMLTSAGEKVTLLFEDDFERSESDETKEEIGKGWSSNSAKRAKGNKQVDLKDGALHITFHPSADHAVSVVHPAGFRDGKVTLRFQLPTEKDSLGLNFADLSCKEVHAGHLCMTRVGTTNVQISDLKTGNMKKEIREARLADKLTAEQKKMVHSKNKRIPNTIAPNQWHNLEVTIRGKTMTVEVNGKPVGSFTSEGIAHPTKRTLRVAVPHKAVIDDLKIYAIEDESLPSDPK